MDITDMISTKRLQGFNNKDLWLDLKYQALLRRLFPDWQTVKNLWARRAWQRFSKETILEQRMLRIVGDGSIGREHAQDHRFSLGTTAKLHNKAVSRLGLQIKKQRAAKKHERSELESSGKKKKTKQRCRSSKSTSDAVMSRRRASLKAQKLDIWKTAQSRAGRIELIGDSYESRERRKVLEKGAR